MKTGIIYPALLFLATAFSASTANAQNRTTHQFQDAGTNTYHYSERPAELYAFPNPAVNNVTVQLPFVAHNAVDILLLDFNGTVIRNFRFAGGGQSYSIDVSFLQIGNYVLHVHEGNRPAGYVKLVKGDGVIL